MKNEVSNADDAKNYVKVEMEYSDEESEVCLNQDYWKKNFIINMKHKIECWNDLSFYYKVISFHNTCSIEFKLFNVLFKDVDWNQENFYFGEDDSKMEEFSFKEEIQVIW